MKTQRIQKTLAVAELKKIKRRRWRVVSNIALVLFFLLASVSGGVLAYFYHQLPPLNQLEEQKPSVITTVYSDKDEVIAEFYIERRMLLRQDQIPQKLKEAIIAVEDDIFYNHWGIDFLGIFRAFLKNIRAGRVVQGGSTITQQLAKVLFLTPEQKLIRKIKEALLALQIESRYTKDEILTFYLNQIYFGEGAYGIEAASQTYFGKQVNELKLEEIALLCGLPKAPSFYTPFKNPEHALRRRNIVLNRMFDEGYIDSAEYEKTKDLPIVTIENEKQRIIAPYFVEEIRKYLDLNYGTRVLYREGLKVYSTLNLELQRAAEKAVEDGLLDHQLRHSFVKYATQEEAHKVKSEYEEKYEGSFEFFVASVSKVARWNVEIEVDGEKSKLSRNTIDTLASFHGTLRSLLKKGDLLIVTPVDEEKSVKNDRAFRIFQEPEAEGSLLSVEVGSGDIKAMVGGFNYKRSKFNRVTQALRQVGSAFKPFVYLAAIDNGYSPSTILVDELYTYKDPQSGVVYEPKNHEKNFLGPVTMTTSLAKSINVVAVKMLQKLGIDIAIEYAQKMGIRSTLQPYLSLALGSSEIVLSELTNAYAVFPNGGVWREMKMIRAITDREGRMLEQKVPQVREVVSADVAYVMTNMLQASVQRGTCWRARALNRPVAAKTGTTDNYQDAWFLGFSPELVTGTWVGYDQRKSLGRLETGSRAAGPIWVDFMKHALEPLENSSFRIPSGIILVEVEIDSGLRYQQGCGEHETAAFVRGTEPTDYCKPSH